MTAKAPVLAIFAGFLAISCTIDQRVATDPVSLFLEEEHGLASYDRADRDLNGDGVAEHIILATSPGHCGTGGCAMYVIKRDGEGVRLVSKTTIVDRPVRLLEATTNGWRDLEVRARFDAFNSMRATLKYDGKSYPANPTTPPAALAESFQSGAVIFE